ncbi:hypothetical protein [Roseomonas sp. BN140053]|uniref:hypothetical protein n=1 Tax=Roseomonas sp. BN140053 TaxID=3391898 RepID=UPI0039E9963C
MPPSLAVAGVSAEPARPGKAVAPGGYPARHALLAFVACFALLLAAGWRERPRDLGYGDQYFYASVAWDLLHHGVYSDGFFDRVDSATAVPPPGMFLGPGYPALLAGVMALDPALRDAAACTVRHLPTSDVSQRCPPYRGLVLPVNMLLVAGALGLLFLAARRVAAGRLAVAATATAIGLLTMLSYARLLGLAMTESLGLFLFAASALGFLAVWQDGRRRDAALTGAAFGLLLLTRPSHGVLAPLLLAALALAALRAPREQRRRRWQGLLLGAAALAAVTLPWAAHNELVLGRFALTAGYGPAVLVERLAFDAMTPREFGASFLYWLPDFGDAWAERVFGAETVHRLDWNRAGSFYDQGQQDRHAALAQPGSLDDRLPAILRAELARAPLGYAMATVSLAWRGLWVGRYWALAMLVLLPFGLLAARRAGRLGLLLLFAAPSWIMLLVHAGASVNQERYNLSLALGLSIAAAWALVEFAARIRAARPGPVRAGAAN